MTGSSSDEVKETIAKAEAQIAHAKRLMDAIQAQVDRMQALEKMVVTARPC